MNTPYRPIEFRAKANDPERGIIGEWIYGSLIVQEGVDGHEGELTYYILHENEHGAREDVVVDPETIGQFTGVHDMTGRKVYEGDLILSGFNPETISLVFWNHSGFSYTSMNEQGVLVSYPLHLMKDCFVMGDKYAKQEPLDPQPDSPAFVSLHGKSFYRDKEDQHHELTPPENFQHPQVYFTEQDEWCWIEMDRPPVKLEQEF